MDTRQRRRYGFVQAVLLACLIPFLVLPWPAALVLLVWLSIFLASPLHAAWDLVQHWGEEAEPASQPPPEPEPVQRSYEQGYQEQAVASPELAQPKYEYSAELAQPKYEYPPDEDVPQAAYPEMLQS